MMRDLTVGSLEIESTTYHLATTTLVHDERPHSGTVPYMEGSTLIHPY